MSVTYVTVELRQLVVTRAEAICEYCLIAEEDTFFGCELDHIISEKHGGPTSAENLAFACVACNQMKGSDIASIDWETGELTRLYHPRTDKWSHHFLAGNRPVIGSPHGDWARDDFFARPQPARPCFGTTNVKQAISLRGSQKTDGIIANGPKREP